MAEPGLGLFPFRSLADLIIGQSFSNLSVGTSYSRIQSDLARRGTRNGFPAANNPKVETPCFSLLGFTPPLWLCPPSTIA